MLQVPASCRDVPISGIPLVTLRMFKSELVYLDFVRRGQNIDIYFKAVDLFDLLWVFFRAGEPCNLYLLFFPFKKMRNGRERILGLFH